METPVHLDTLGLALCFLIGKARRLTYHPEDLCRPEQLENLRSTLDLFEEFVSRVDMRVLQKLV